MYKWIGRVVDRLFAVVGAFLFSQIPLFMQQYQHHLSGHLNELKIQVTALEKAGSLTGKSLDQYIYKFIENADIDFKTQGYLMQEMVQRYHHLGQGYQALQEASVYSKPFLFLKYISWDIVQSTWKSFAMGFSLTFECATYAMLGVLFGLLVYRMTIGVFVSKLSKQN